jgi:hypothetical protein
MIMEAIIMTILTNGVLNTRIGAQAECKIILEVAENYDLDDEEIQFLASIRRIENGGPGNEFGVGSEDPKHPARRYKSFPDKSVRLQAQYAAGTIKRRYKNDINGFAHRWCPNDWQTWAKNATFYMKIENPQRGK